MLSVLLIPSLSGGETITGGLSILNCEGTSCSGSYEWPVVVGDSGILRIVAPSWANYQPTYAGHAFFSDGRSVLLAVEEDCRNDGSFDECLVVSVFDPAGNLIAERTFYSTYRQTDPQYLMVENSYFEVVDVSTWGDKIVVALDYPRAPMLLILDSDLDITDQISLPATPAALAGPWVVLADQTVLDLRTRELYAPPFGEQFSRYHVTDAVELDGGLAVFYGAPTGLYLELEAPVVIARREGERLKNDKVLWLKFENSELSGAPIILKASKTSSGWMMHLELWQDFGGAVVHGVVSGDETLSHLEFHTIKGARGSEWEGYDLAAIGDLSDQEGKMYLPMATDKGLALTSLSALPLGSSQSMEVTTMDESMLNELGELYWNPLPDARLPSVSYIVECAGCLPMSAKRMEFPLGMVKDPTMFFLTLYPGEASLLADFFCYGPPGYKTYCGFILNGEILIYEGSLNRFVPFDASQMDRYIPLSSMDAPKSIIRGVKVCDGGRPVFPGLDVELFAVSIPQGLSLSRALENGEFLFSRILWETPDCQ